ncbi:hypothetical protein E2R68_01480 [Psychromonas sp. RZ22]|uniref:hypothetical protein n=1 Tax=Psychromonas algarum TaxID=2555643 RepID=UPI00106736C9|nr:hypothetical protein [Psychromonas sp. RZ22]TEW56740.1 hypothetical protein E2R68_01480 [Psychromonas sp. RZ22]
MVKYIISILIFSFSSAAFAENVVSLSTEENNVEKAKIVSDPTLPLGYKAKVNNKKVYRPRLPVLQSIIVDKRTQRAVMNNKSYEVGQKVGGYEISRIEKEAVYLTYRSKIYAVSLYSNSERFSQ